MTRDAVLVDVDADSPDPCCIGYGDELRQQLAALAVAGAGKIIEREIDARAHAQLLDKLVAQI